MVQQISLKQDGGYEKTPFSLYKKRESVNVSSTNGVPEPTDPKQYLQLPRYRFNLKVIPKLIGAMCETPA